jgi:hypothetical protein
MREARQTAGDVRDDGAELADHVKQLGNSLRSNADRLLHDIQAVHSTFLAQIDKVDPSRTALNQAMRGSARHTSDRSRVNGEDDELDVPEFIPRG